MKEGSYRVMLPQLSMSVPDFRQLLQKLVRGLLLLVMLMSLTACNGSQPPRVLRRVTSASRRDSLVAEPGREPCDHLREHPAAGLECGDDAEALSRLLTSTSLCSDALRASAILGAASCARACLERKATSDVSSPAFPLWRTVV